jgi:hypothetical protein
MSIKMVALILLGAGIIIALILWGYDRFVNPQMTIKPSAFERPRFPTVKGSNLAGQDFILPEEIEAKYAVLMIAFKQYQQFDVNTWIPVVRELSEVYDELAYYELPTIDRLNPAARSFIDGGMRGGIPDPVARAATITLYLNKPDFREVLDIENEDSIVVLLIDRTGEIYWREEGLATQAAIESLQTAIKSIFG